MEKFVTVTESYEDLYQILMGAVKARFMMSALDLKVFNELDSFHSADQVAEILGTHHGNTRRLLDALTMIDLLEKKNGLYRNLPVAQAFLVEGSHTYLGPFLQLSQKMNVDTLDDLKGLVLSGPTAEVDGAGMGSEALWAEAARAGAGWALGGVARFMAETLSVLPEFSSFRKMLDLGGGAGIFAIAMVDAHPSMKGVVFDQPAVAKVAEEYINAFHMEDRIRAVGGDYTRDVLGNDYDLIWACATLNFVKQDMDAMIKRIYDALNPGGVFISFQDGMTHEQTQPETMLGHFGHAMMTGIDVSLDQGFVADAMLRAGFRSVCSRTLETPIGPMDMDVARKLIRPEKERFPTH